MSRCVYSLVTGLAVSTAAWGFAGSPGGQSAGNGWMDTLNLPSLGSDAIQDFRLFKTSPLDGIDHILESRSLFRVEGDTRERNYGNGSASGLGVSGSFVGSLDGSLDQGGLDFVITQDTVGPIFNSHQRWAILDGGGVGPGVVFREEVQNATPQERVFFAYQYFSTTLDGAAVNSVALGRDYGFLFLSGPESEMRVSAFTSGAPAELTGVYASTDGSARELMFDGVVDDLTGETFAGAPSGTVQIVFEWRLTLGAFESVDIGYEFAFIPAPSGVVAMLGGLGAAMIRRRR